MYTPSLAGDPVGCERRAAYLRASASPGAAIAIMKMNRDIDVRHVLPAIRVPTLILHRTAEQVIDVANARYMAEHIRARSLSSLRASTTITSQAIATRCSMRSRCF